MAAGNHYVVAHGIAIWISEPIQGRPLGIKPPHSNEIARLLVLLEQAGVEVNQLLSLRAFTTFAVQCRYDDEPEELGLDRPA